MKIFLLADGWVGWKIGSFLAKRKENIIGLGLHPVDKRNLGKEIIEAIQLPPTKIFTGPNCLDPIKSLRPDIIISSYWGYIIKPEIIRLAPKGCINLHPSFLPFNRGKNPNVWSIIEDTRAGATIHYIDERVDTGDIIAQQEVNVEPVDTALTVFEKSIQALIHLFKETWPKIKKGVHLRVKQDHSGATFHLAKELRRLDEIDLNKFYKAKDLINILRARTFPPYPSAYFIQSGKKVYARVQLEYAK